MKTIGKRHLKTHVEVLESRAMFAGDSAGFVGVGAFSAGFQSHDGSARLAGEVASALSSAGGSALGAVGRQSLPETRASAADKLTIDANFQSALAADATFELASDTAVLTDASLDIGWTLGDVRQASSDQGGVFDALLEVLDDLRAELLK